MTRINVYIIYYGNWSASSKSLVETFISDLNGPASSSSSVATVGRWWAISTKNFSRVGGFFGQQSFVSSVVSSLSTRRIASSRTASLIAARAVG